MFDFHVHLGLNLKLKENTKEEIENKIEAIIKKYAEYGIFFLRDGGDKNKISLIARNIAKRYGIDYKTPIYAISKKNHYGEFLGRQIDDMKDFDDILLELKDLKADHLKIIASDLVDFKNYNKDVELSFSKEELGYMIDKAKEIGLNSMVHVNSANGIDNAIEAGASSIEHGIFMENHQLDKMKTRNIFWIPTLSPLGNLLKSKEEYKWLDKDVLKKIFEDHSKIVQIACSKKVMIGIGSDAGSIGVEHVEGYFDEEKYLKEAIKSKDFEKEIIKKNQIFLKKYF